MPDIERAMARYQEILAAHVVQEDVAGDAVSLVGGVDVAYSGDEACAAACIFSWPGLEELECSVVSMTAPYPYKPGFFVMREGPPVARAVRGLGRRPRLLFVNGGGIDHPRGLGLASHLGVVLDMPAVGVTRKPVAAGVRGDDLFIGNRLVGKVLRGGGKVAYVSPGHMVSVEGAVRWARACTRTPTWPWPLEVAHRRAGDACRKSAGKSD